MTLEGWLSLIAALLTALAVVARAYKKGAILSRLVQVLADSIEDAPPAPAGEGARDDVAFGRLQARKGIKRAVQLGTKDGPLEKVLKPFVDRAGRAPRLGSKERPFTHQSSS